MLYAGYLVEDKKKSSTIKSYISAIRSVLTEDGVILNENSFLLTSLTKACKLINDRVRTRLPIQKGMLKVIITHTDRIFATQPYLAALYKAMFMAAYYGMLRVGELSSSQHVILAKNVHIGENKKKLLFILQTSKTHWKDVKPQMVKITSTKKENSYKDSDNPAFYPFRIIKQYIKIRPPAEDTNEQLYALVTTQ